MKEKILKIVESLISTLFPRSKEEWLVNSLNKDFPISLTTYKIQKNSSLHAYKIVALADYADKRIATLIHLFKYGRNSSATQLIAKVLSEYLLEEIASHAMVYPDKRLLIIPMPSSRKRHRERGFSQMNLLLTEVAKQTPELKPLIQHSILKREKDTLPQTHLPKKERLSNVIGVFTSANLNNENIFLIDDVLTTGATALEASTTLTRAGAKSVTIIAIAHPL